MHMVLDIETFQHGESGERKLTWVRLQGRDQNSRFLKAMAYGPAGDAIIREVERLTPPGEDVGSHGFVVKLEGEWKQREIADKTIDRHFRVANFEFLTGPSAELSKARKAAGAALDAAAEALGAGDIAKAYKVSEAFIAAFARRPAPSVDHASLLENEVEENLNPAEMAEAGIEEQALQRLQENDARRGIVPPPAPAASVAAQASAGLPDEASAEESAADVDDENAPEATAPEKPASVAQPGAGMRRPQLPPAGRRIGAAAPQASNVVDADAPASSAPELSPAAAPRPAAVRRPMRPGMAPRVPGM